MNRLKFHIQKSTDAQWFYTLLGGNGEVLAVSEMYTRKADAKRAVRKLRTGMLTAQVQEDSE